jgi:uncharacterized membrane protein YkoI
MLVSQEVSPDKLPAKVKEGLQAKYKDAKIQFASKSSGTQVRYSINIVHNKERLRVTFAEDGDLIEVSKAITAKELPKPVVDAVMAKFPGAMIELPVKITRKGMTYFDLEIHTDDEKLYSMVLDEKGKILEQKNRKEEENPPPPTKTKSPPEKKEKNKPFTPSDLPEKVLTTIKKEYGSLQIVSGKETYFGKVRVFAVDLLEDGRDIRCMVDLEGTILASTRSLNPAKVPKEIQTVIDKKYPGFKFRYGIESRELNKLGYYIVLEDKEGTTTEITFDAKFNITKEKSSK